MSARVELLEAVKQRYGDSSRGEKRRILDEFVALTGYHRKHALRLLNSPMESGAKARKPRSRIYDEAVLEALIIVWEAADRICGKRLKAAMPSLVEAMERHGHLHLGEELRALLLGISASTIDRMLAPQRAVTGRRRPRRCVLGRKLATHFARSWPPVSEEIGRLFRSKLAAFRRPAEMAGHIGRNGRPGC